jgi:hypothetical protein
MTGANPRKRLAGPFFPNILSQGRLLGARRATSSGENDESEDFRSCWSVDLKKFEEEINTFLATLSEKCREARTILRLGDTNRRFRPDGNRLFRHHLVRGEAKTPNAKKAARQRK